MQPFCQDFFIFACRGQRLVVQRDSDGGGSHAITPVVLKGAT